MQRSPFFVDLFCQSVFFFAAAPSLAVCSGLDNGQAVAPVARERPYEQQAVQHCLRPCQISWSTYFSGEQAVQHCQKPHQDATSPFCTQAVQHCLSRRGQSDSDPCESIQRGNDSFTTSALSKDDDRACRCSLAMIMPYYFKVR